jgi:hypothetical protein
MRKRPRSSVHRLKAGREIGGRRYKLYGKASLTEEWPLLPLYEVIGDGQPKSFTAPTGEGSAKFFRLTVEVLPEE